MCSITFHEIIQSSEYPDQSCTSCIVFDLDSTNCTLSLCFSWFNIVFSISVDLNWCLWFSGFGSHYGVPMTVCSTVYPFCWLHIIETSWWLIKIMSEGHQQLYWQTSTTVILNPHDSWRPWPQLSFQSIFPQLC